MPSCLHVTVFPQSLQSGVSSKVTQRKGECGGNGLHSAKETCPWMLVNMAALNAS